MPLPPHIVEKSWPYLLALGAFLLGLCVLLAVGLGAVSIGMGDIWAVLTGSAEPRVQLIVQSLRLPRALMAAFVGATLAVCGAVAQGLFRNPLADPSLIGVSAGASAGAAVAIVLLGSVAPIGGLNIPWVVLGAFAGAITVVVAVYRLARSVYGTSVTILLLVGVALSYLAGSLASLLEFFSSNDQLRQLSLWRMGGISVVGYGQVVFLAVILGLCALAAMLHAPALNALLLGESEARHLGIDVERLKRYLFVVIAGGVAVSVALVGTIAFVGLIVPHAVRLLIGPDHRYLIPASALLGAMLLLLADTLGRIILVPAELPVGLMTSLLGAPLFIYLLARRRATFG